MSQRVVLKSFADLALVLQLEDTPPTPGEETSPPNNARGESVETPDLGRLLAELNAASATLADIARRDEEHRATALRDLEQYDALVAAQQEGEQARARAEQVRRGAEALAQTGFIPEARDTAARVAESARQIELAAARWVETQRTQIEALGVRLDLERLLAERRRHEEAQRARAEAAERAHRVASAVSAAQAALTVGHWEEARAVLAPVACEARDVPEVKELRQRIAQREFAARVTHADEALWAARREFRRDPTAALTRLESLDVDGLPEALSRQIFGTWARACARLCQERQMDRPLRYAPDPGRGVVMAHQTTTDTYVVVSALGMGDGWHVGDVVSQRIVERARPLR